MRSHLVVVVALVGLVAGSGCESTKSGSTVESRKKSEGDPQPLKVAGHTDVQPAAVKMLKATGHYDRPGYSTVMVDGRLWVFPENSEEYREFLKGTEPAKHVSLVKAGPGGYTLRGIDRETLEGYLAVRPGFETAIVDGRIWVFRPGTEALMEFRNSGEPAKFVTRPRAGPMNMTVRGPDMETVLDYLTARPGFRTFVVDGRLWVFRNGSPDIEEFQRVGEPAKHVTVPRGGPLGMTIKAPDRETIREYSAHAPGFDTFLVDERIWVFRVGSEEVQEFLKMGEPAKFVTLVRAGPMNMTVRAPDRQTANDYLRVVGLAN